MGARNFSLLQNVPIYCGSPSSSYSVSTGVLSQEPSRKNITLTTYLYLVLRIKMGVLLVFSLHTLMAWTGANLLLLNINYNTVLFTVCWITEQWDLIFTRSRGFSLLQNMPTDSGDWGVSPWRVERGLKWQGCEVDQSLPVLRLKTCGTKPPIHSPIHHHGMTLN